MVGSAAVERAPAAAGAEAAARRAGVLGAIASLGRSAAEKVSSGGRNANGVLDPDPHKGQMIKHGAKCAEMFEPLPSLGG
jgi:hypothetical protein